MGKESFSKRNWTFTNSRGWHSSWHNPYGWGKQETTLSEDFPVTIRSMAGISDPANPLGCPRPFKGGQPLSTYSGIGREVMRVFGERRRLLARGRREIRRNRHPLN